MKQACVMGSPITHSLSPRLHGHWLKVYGLDGAYTARDVQAKDLKEALQRITDEGFAGCNLTMPLKEVALPLMDNLDKTALVANAVNTVVIENGQMTGYNSDGYGFVESLKVQAPDYSGARCVVLGAGGAVRGILPALQAQGVQSFAVVNRTVQKAQGVVDTLNLNADVFTWDDLKEALKDATLIINCTSLGMAGHDALNIDLSVVSTPATVCDIVYRPLLTPLLINAKAQGHTIVEGLPMLLHQGRLGFKKWFGQDPRITKELYDEMAEAAA